MSRKETPSTITVEQAAKHIDRWSVGLPYVNSFTSKREAAVLYGGKITCVQLGTPANPIYTPFGASYWANSRFASISSNKDTQWAYADQASSQFKRKEPGGKVQVQATLFDSDTPGTQGNLIKTWINGVQDQIIESLVTGVPDGDQRDENGQPKLVKIINDSTLPVDPEGRRAFFRHMLTGPLDQRNAEYAPQLKMKIRYAIRNETIVFPSTRVHKADDMSVVPHGEELNWIVPKVRGVWVVKVNPLQIKQKEINFTLDVTLVAVIPQNRSIFNNVGFAPMETREDNDDEVAASEVSFAQE